MPVASPSRKDEVGRAPAAEPSWHSRACLWLLFGTLVWGLSFPLLKVIALAQQRLVPGASSWFLASLTVCVRFAAAALALFCWCLPTLGRLTRSEIWHGLGLGVFGGAGMFLQVDGLMYTAASTSAFLTQMTCLLIPLWVALQHRRFPSLMVLASVGIVLATLVTAVINATVMPASPSVPIVAIAILISILVGVAAGMAPALRGARLDPVEALRHE